MPPDRNFNDALQTFFHGCKRISHDHTKKNYPSLRVADFELQRLKKRYRISQNGSAFCFVDIATGDVLKAASWLAPAKHARGNIFDEHNGLSKIGPYGPQYLR